MTSGQVLIKYSKLNVHLTINEIYIIFNEQIQFIFKRIKPYFFTMSIETF